MRIKVKSNDVSTRAIDSSWRELVLDEPEDYCSAGMIDREIRNDNYWETHPGFHEVDLGNSPIFEDLYDLVDQHYQQEEIAMEGGGNALPRHVAAMQNVIPYLVDRFYHDLSEADPVHFPTRTAEDLA